jgi:beta-lactamase superfamily II metal-dependent hydrolase
MTWMKFLAKTGGNMPATHVINVDLARVTDDGGSFLRYLAWGDFVEVVDDPDANPVRIRATRMVEERDGSVRPVRIVGTIKQPEGRSVVIPRDQSKVLKVNFVDVQQGDGTVIETPGGKLLLIDGGDNQLFARYLAARYRNTREDRPLKVDCILVTHGDADHFLGLTEIHRSEQHTRSFKRLFIRPERIYHNGLVKRPSRDAHGKRTPDSQLLGPTTRVDGRAVVTELVENLLTFPTEQMNMPFRRWQAALAAYEKRYGASHGPIAFRRLAQGDDQAFDFLKDGEPLAARMQVEVLGPLVTPVNGNPGLRFLGNPPEDVQIDFNPDHPRPEVFKGASASHTINGHSVILRLTYGNFRFLFAGDLNAEAELDLVQHHRAQLEAEVLKAPHHGSADFSVDFISAVAPIVSVISSGDESTRKEYIHPRASLVGALGRCSRIDKPTILVTELAAFFTVEGFIDTAFHAMRDGVKVPQGLKVVDLKALAKKGKRFFAFSRSAFGMVKVRTDGDRLLVYTDSGNVKLKEAYAYEIAGGQPRAVNVIQA